MNHATEATGPTECGHPLKGFIYACPVCRDETVGLLRMALEDAAAYCERTYDDLDQSRHAKFIRGLIGESIAGTAPCKVCSRAHPAHHSCTPAEDATRPA